MDGVWKLLDFKNLLAAVGGPFLGGLPHSQHFFFFYSLEITIMHYSSTCLIKLRINWTIPYMGILLNLS